MHRVLLSVLLSAVLIAAGSSAAWAFNSGAIEVGDVKDGKVTGTIVGQAFSKLPVDLEFTVLKIGGKTVWYPPTQILNLRNQGTGARPQHPIVFKVTNALDTPHSFVLSADSAYAAPTSMQVNVTIPPGETKMIGIAVSHFTYVTAAGMLKYECGLHSAHGSGQMLIMK